MRYRREHGIHGLGPLGSNEFHGRVSGSPGAHTRSHRSLACLAGCGKAIGADQVKCVTFSGTGYAGRVGQNVTQDTDWPRGALTCTDVSELSALLIASLRRDFGGGSFYDGYITAVRVEHFILRRNLRG